MIGTWPHDAERSVRFQALQQWNGNEKRPSRRLQKDWLDRYRALAFAQGIKRMPSL
jgi:hypothetical protein